MSEWPVIAEGGLDLLNEIARYLQARGIESRKQRPPPGACSTG
jgi:hypothetical protein